MTDALTLRNRTAAARLLGLSLAEIHIASGQVRPLPGDLGIPLHEILTAVGYAYDETLDDYDVETILESWDEGYADAAWPGACDTCGESIAPDRRHFGSAGLTCAECWY